ncbi:MAG TPA: metallophosphoesterase [Thermodesulfovibrionales bacterium]|nr:metallophosphoesterase [Thermodesulfovibrionales bacterium]
MSLFFLVFFLLYGGLHLYAFLKAKSAFAFGIHAGLPLALFMLVMVFAPVIIRLSERAGHDLFARLFSYTGYTWMGVLFLFCSVSLLTDLYRSVISLAGLVLKADLSGLALSNQYAFFLPLGVALSIAFYGYFEARDIRTELVTIKTSKIPEDIGRLRIVQISDVHIGLIVRQERVSRILAEVKKADPDIFVSTGDLVDGQINGLTGLSEMLREINPRYGKFAITGNHEYYAGLDQALAFTEKAGFRVLRGEGLTVGGMINIAGVEDPAGKAFGLFRGRTERVILERLPREKFTLLLKHRPLIEKESLGLFDLQLSGHVHKGQIFPFSVVTWLYYPVASGGRELSGNAYLYVSRGSGTWGPPIRFLAPPEVTVIDLIHDEGTKSQEEH